MSTDLKSVGSRVSTDVLFNIHAGVAGQQVPVFSVSANKPAYQGVAVLCRDTVWIDGANIGNSLGLP